MNRVDQTAFTDLTTGTAGNCVSACIASILEIPIEEVPHFAQLQMDRAKQNEGGKGLKGMVVEFLNSKGLDLICCEWVTEHDGIIPRCYFGHNGRHAILSGKSPRGVCDHAVVGEAKGYGMWIVHDPHPSRDGITGDPYAVWFIVPAGGPK